MPKCRFCDHENPRGIDRCGNCGAWLEQAVRPAWTGQESETFRSEPTAQPNELESQILSLMQQGQKIAAVKLYREQTGSGLKEAKDAVEALAAGEGISRGNPETAGIQPDSLEGQILALMHDRKKIGAIKLYREQTGSGLKEAKDAVEALAMEHGISPKGAGCAGAVLLIAAFCATLGIGIWGVLSG